MHLFEQFTHMPITPGNTLWAVLHLMKQLESTVISISMSIQIPPMINVMKSVINTMMKLSNIIKLKSKTQYPMPFVDIP